MADEGTHYSSGEPEPTAYEELEELDWSNSENPPVDDAVELIHEILTTTDADEGPSLQELLADIPPDYRQEITDAVHQLGSEGADYGQPAHASEQAESGTQDQVETGTQDAADGNLQWETENTRDALRYVERTCDYSTREKLEQAIEDNRSLRDLRMMGHHTELFGTSAYLDLVGKVGRIQETVEAKQAADPVRWNDSQLAERVKHEVNRMGFRMRSEIFDRLVQPTWAEPLADLARERNLAQETVELLARSEARTANWANGRRSLQDLTTENMNVAYDFNQLRAQLEAAITRDDEIAIQAMLGATTRQEAARQRNWPTTEEYQNSVGTIEAALDITERWSDEDILDGYKGYHALPTALDYGKANDERIEWLRENTDHPTPDEETNDCVTRALNEALGGGHYGEIHAAITERLQVDDPTKNADHGAPISLFRDVYIEHGLHPILETDHANPMRKHLYLEEIPTLLGHLFEDRDEPLTFIACPEHHAQAVVDGTLRDIADWRGAPDDPMKHETHGITAIFLKCDDENVLNEAREILRRYAEAVRLDEELTFSVLRRQSTRPGG